jgi:Pyruvate/2-oxoacid:ferredoxin oxidoreductase gamma subunit
MLGILWSSKNLPIKKETLENSIFNFVPKKAKNVNERAFKLGIKEGEKIRGD